MCLGFTLWFDVVNGLLSRFAESEVWHIQAFADYVFVLACSSVVFRFANLLIPILVEIRRWVTKCSLEFIYDKCCYTIVPLRGKYSNTSCRVIRMYGHKVAFRWKFKCLRAIRWLFNGS